MNQHSDQGHLLNIPVAVAFTGENAKELYGEDLAPATSHSAGLDLRAVLDADEAVIPAGERLAVGTGLRVQPKVPGFAGFVYSRSGLGAKTGLTVAQGVGVIDPDYTGEIVVFLLNTSRVDRRISRGERIAQLIFQPYAQASFTEVDDLQKTERGAGGFGHTGK